MISLSEIQFDTKLKELFVGNSSLLEKSTIEIV